MAKFRVRLFGESYNDTPIIITGEQFEKLKPLLATEQWVTINDNYVKVSGISAITEEKEATF